MQAAVFNQDFLPNSVSVAMSAKLSDAAGLETNQFLLALSANFFGIQGMPLSPFCIPEFVASINLKIKEIHCHTESSFRL